METIVFEYVLLRFSRIVRDEDSISGQQMVNLIDLEGYKTAIQNYANFELFPLDEEVTVEAFIL